MYKMSEFRAISSQELKKIILSKKIKTSVSDVIPAQLLTNNIDQIIEAFTMGKCFG